MIFDAFHICCQKVLPAVYDESLSYYEVVCKLVYAMQVLDQSMTDLEARMDVLDKISTELWPQFQAEVNATLQQYAKAYEDFQTGIEADISKFESDLETMNTNLANSIKEQNAAITAANAAQMTLLTERLAQQDGNISQIQSTVEQNSQDMADLTMDVHDFIAQYSPPATINGLSPQFLITANAGASLKAVQGLIELTATADGAGKAVINVSNYGDWVVTSQYQGQTKSVTVSVDDVKQYTVNVEQAEKTYTFILNPIPNFADLPSIITESMFQISGPNGYSVTKPVQATAQSFSVPGPGEYSFDLKIANIYPDASSETGYKAASASGAVIYTSTPKGVHSSVMTDANSNNVVSVTVSGLPYFTISLPSDKTITITSPVTATDIAQTVTSTNSTYKFIPWTIGVWEFTSSTKDDSYMCTVENWNVPQAIYMSLFLPLWNTVTGKTFFTISPFNMPTLIDPDQTVVNQYSGKYDELKKSICLVTVSPAGNIENILPWGADITNPPTGQFIGVYIPSFSVSVLSSYYNMENNNSNIHSAFYNKGGMPCSGIVLLYQRYYTDDSGAHIENNVWNSATLTPSLLSTPITNTNFYAATTDHLLLISMLLSFFFLNNYRTVIEESNNNFGATLDTQPTYSTIRLKWPLPIGGIFISPQANKYGTVKTGWNSIPFPDSTYKGLLSINQHGALLNVTNNPNSTVTGLNMQFGVSTQSALGVICTQNSSINTNMFGIEPSNSGVGGGIAVVYID